MEAAPSVEVGPCRRAARWGRGQVGGNRVTQEPERELHIVRVAEAEFEPVRTAFAKGYPNISLEFGAPGADLLLRQPQIEPRRVVEVGDLALANPDRGPGPESAVA